MFPVKLHSRWINKKSLYKFGFLRLTGKWLCFVIFRGAPFFAFSPIMLSGRGITAV